MPTTGCDVNLLLFGPDGCGKTTQGELFAQHFGLRHIEPGAVFREQAGQHTRLGDQAQQYIRRGQLVPNSIIIPIIHEALTQDRQQGWVLDGFPRSSTQARSLWVELGEAGLPLDWVIEIDAPRELTMERTMGRRICASDAQHTNNLSVPQLQPVDGRCRLCGGELSIREDDQNEPAIQRKLDIYYDKNAGTQSAIDFFKEQAALGQTKYQVVDGSGLVDEIHARILAIIGV